jgi:DNA-directed RNA polymerase specialized sigma24 family protein
MTKTQDQSTTVQRKYAIQRYDEIRREIARMLEKKLTEDAQLATDELHRIVQRREVMDQLTRYFVPLRRFVDRELHALIDEGYVEAESVDPEDVLMSAIVQAQEDIPADISSPGVFQWLREVCRSRIQEMTSTAHEQGVHEESLDAPQSLYGTDWPEHVLILREVLADPNALIPDAVLQQKLTKAILDQTLRYLPERWREVFLLRSVDAWDDDEIALAEGIDVQEVELINLAARAYLRECLRDCALLHED